MGTIIEHSGCVAQQKVGKFKVTRKLIQSEPDALMECVFSKVLIIEAHTDFQLDCVIYTAYSDLFDKCEACSEPPEYCITVSCDRKITAKRV